MSTQFCKLMIKYGTNTGWEEMRSWGMLTYQMRVKCGKVRTVSLLSVGKINTSVRLLNVLSKSSAYGCICEYK